MFLRTVHTCSGGMLSSFKVEADHSIHTEVYME